MIGYEEWAALLAGATEVATDGLTARGWSERLGIPYQRTGKWVADGLAAGWLEKVTIVRPAITGISRRTIGFRVKPREGG